MAVAVKGTRLRRVLRGKVHWPSQAKRQAAQRLEFRCFFDERSVDTPQNRTPKADLGVSGEDVYQVLAHAHRYATSSAVLIYPHHAALGRPGLQRDFVVQASGGSKVVVRVATVDLARLKRVAGEVGEAVCA